MCTLRADMRGCLALCAVLAGCGGDDHTTTISCSGTASGTLSAGGAVTGKGSLGGAAIAADDHTTLPAAAVTIACSPDIVPTGFTALGPAITFGAEGTWSDRPFMLTLPYKAARLPKGGGRAHVRIVAQHPGGTAYFPAVANRTLDDMDAYDSHATFQAGELTTYQMVVADTAGQQVAQQFAWNAIVGVSMGGNAAMSIALRHPDRFDEAGDLGGEPGPSMVYTLAMVRDFLFGGFCTADDQAAGRGNIGALCPNKSTKPDQFEVASDYEHMLTQTGDGIGLTLDRGLYMKASRDLSRALGNPALYNPSNAYAPPGVDFSYFATDPATRCANPIVLHDFFDREFNPDGKKPVITFCDGGDVPGMNGVFDPTQPQTSPAEVLLAVDLNGNGKRDLGEPVITNAYEPFQDVGTDGKADKDEPGYDPVTNPDPDGDDYHYLRNPLGTEGNGNYDVGEPFDDIGLDGVAGTCQAGATPPTGVSGCYDYGEGNGKWDISPNVLRWYDSDLQKRLASITADQRAHMALWFDAGLRDFLQNSVSANAAIGQAMATGELPFGVYHGFGGLLPGATEQVFDFTSVAWDDLPKNAYLRYGDADATPDEIMAGDGRHVGTGSQIIFRIESAFGWIDHHMPDGDRDDTLDSGTILKDQTFTSTTTGRVNPFALFLPPGYDMPENANKRYPVIYVLHGYGQQPDDLVALSAIIANHMIATEPIETRIQKFIMVYADGRCSPGGGDPVPPTGDGCEEGTFYLDSPINPTAHMEQNLLDLMDHIDATYRTKQAASAMVTN